MSFSDLDLPDFIHHAIKTVGYDTPTPIQTEAIPLIQAGHDIIAQAQTGTGKTAAFAFPVLEKIKNENFDVYHRSVQTLVLAPTRELALQVTASFRVYGQYLGRKLNAVAVIGGAEMDVQVDKLWIGSDVVVATPGRLLEIMENDDIDLSNVHTFVIDEADKMLNLGFADALDLILAALPKKRQNLLFSATFPERVMALSEKVTTEPKRVEVESRLDAIDHIKQRVIEVDAENRGPLLRHLIKAERWGLTLVFAASRRTAANLTTKLHKHGVKAAELHGDLKHDERVHALKMFKAKRVKVLVATDIAARGIDVTGITHVVNFDLPRSTNDYVHRIGRTGRAGNVGTAVSFVTYESEAHLKLIEKRTGIKLTREQIEGFEVTGERPEKVKGQAPVKGKRKSKKDRLREQQENKRP